MEDENEHEDPHRKPISCVSNYDGLCFYSSSHLQLKYMFHIFIFMYTWIYENIAPEILPYVSFAYEILIFFFLHFSFDS